MGEIIEEKFEIVCELDVIFCEEIVKVGLDCDVWQYFIVNIGVCFVGVMGDGCIYDYIIVICVIILIDGMIVDFV